MSMSSTAAPASASPTDVLSRLRASVPRAVSIAFEQALLKTELWLSELSAEQAAKGQADTYGTDSINLKTGSTPAVQRCRDALSRAVDAIGMPASGVPGSISLSLIEDEQMEMQLAGERLIEKLANFHQIGLDALDARLHAVFSTGPYGKRLPLAPQVLADAASDGLGGITLSGEFKVLAFRHFEALVDPVLSDLLKELNGTLAAAGVLPHLVIQDAEEKRRRETLRASSSAKPPADPPKESASPAPATGEAAATTTARPYSAIDQALVNNLIDLVRAASLARMPAGPQRQMDRPESIALLDMMQATGKDSKAVLDAIGRPDGSIADALKREMTQNAQRLGMAGKEEHVRLPEAEDTAVELAGQMFEVMLRDRP
jgi:hypothetical protein